MAETYTLEAVLSARDAGFSAGLKQATSQASSFGFSVKKSFAFGAIVRAGQTAFSSITSGIKGMVSELSASSATWQTFEGNMKNFGKSTKEISAVKAELQDFATKTIYSSSDMASTYSQMAAVGVKDTANLVKAFGGLAAAAENPQQAMKTLSQQGTQMAAKPTIAWQDFKLMLEQTPAGVAAVAKAMGTTTQGLIKNVQAGTVKTEDFFNAMKKAAGQGTKFEEMATSFKTVEQAVDGLKETITNKLQPAFDVLNKYGIKAVEGLTSIFDKFNGDEIAKKLSDTLGKIKIDDVLNTFKQLAGVGAALMAVNTAMTIFGAGSKVVSAGMGLINNASIVMPQLLTNVGTTLTQLGQKAGAVLPMITSHFQGLFTKISGITTFMKEGFISAFGDGILPAIGNFIAPFTSKLQALLGPISAVGGQMLSGLSTMISLAMKMLLPAALIATVLAGLGVLYSKFGEQIDQILVMVQTKGPEIIQKFSESIIASLPSLIETGAQLVINILNAITANIPAIMSAGIQIISTLVEGLSQALPNLMVAAVETIGTFVVSLMAGLPQLINSGMTLLLSVAQGIAQSLPLIIEYAGQAINSFITGLGQNLPSILTSGVQIIITLVQGLISAIPTIIQTGIEIITNLGRTILDNLPLFIGCAVELIVALATGLIQAIPQLLSGMGDVLKSLIDFIIHTDWIKLGLDVAAAIGKGILNGLGPVGKKIADFFGIDLKWGDSGKKGGKDTIKGASQGITESSSLITQPMQQAGQKGGTALGNGVKTGSKTATDSLKLLQDSSKTTQSNLDLLSTSGTKSLNTLGTSFKDTAKDAKQSGKETGTNYSEEVNKGLKKSVQYAKTNGQNMNKTFSSTLRSGRAAVQQAGAYLAQGVAVGLRSKMGEIRSVAQEIISTVDSAMRAAGQIHSPSKLTEEIGIYLARGVVYGLRRGGYEVIKMSGAIMEKSMTKMEQIIANAKVVKAAQHAFNDVHKTVKVSLMDMVGEMRSAVDAVKGGYGISGDNFIDAFTEKVTESLEDSSRLAKASIQDAFNRYYQLAELQNDLDANKSLIERNEKTISIRKDANEALEDKIKENKKLVKANAKTVEQQRQNNVALRRITRYQDQIYANKKFIQSLEFSNHMIEKENKDLEKKLTQNKELATSQFDTFYNKFSKYLTKAADKAKTATQSAIKEITSQYQSLYDSIISKQENYASKLSDIGELYTVDTYGATSFANLQRMTEQAKAYASNITKLKKLLPDGFIESILGNMSRDQGLAYTNALLKKSEAELKEYGAQYTELMETSEHLAQRNYIGQLTSVEANFHNAVLDTYKGLEAELQNLGSDSLAGFIKGMSDGTGALQSAAEKMGLTLTGTLKNVLQIGSPSKVLRKMGQFAGEGFVEGLLAMASQIKTATAEVFGIDDSSMRLAYAGVDLPEGAQYSPIVRQETTVITTLDGREVARTIVDPMSDELNRKNRRDGRKNGKL